MHPISQAAPVKGLVEKSALSLSRASARIFGRGKARGTTQYFDSGPVQVNVGGSETAPALRSNSENFKVNLLQNHEENLS